jgi:hypothetical protein
MKYICLGYMEEKKWETMSESERNALMDECFAYDELRKNGNFAGGEGLQSARNSTTLRWKTGKVSITDGPYAETKEHLGGIGVLEARDPDDTRTRRGRETWRFVQRLDTSGTIDAPKESFVSST